MVDTSARRVDFGGVQVFLVRHADAVDAAPHGVDAERHLTVAGRSAARAVGQRLRWYDCRPGAMWTSPLVRAVQTAELVALGLPWTGLIEAVPALAPGGDAHEVEALLRRQPVDGAVFLIGHEPDLSGLGTLLTRSAAFPGLSKGEVARIDGNHLRWLFAASDEAPRPRSALLAR
jgi:phosphohistidine phosphatase